LVSHIKGRIPAKSVREYGAAKIIETDRGKITEEFRTLHNVDLLGEMRMAPVTRVGDKKIRRDLVRKPEGKRRIRRW
jgi:hypothetical protein